MTRSLTYDARGRLISEDDSAEGTATYRYDAVGRLVAENTAFGGVTYRYDALGRRSELVVPGVAPVTYDYDAASRLRQVSQGAQVATMDYDDAGRRTLLTLPNGVTTESQYDLASHIIRLIYRHGANTLGDLEYSYDAAGNRNRVGGSFSRTLLPDAVTTSDYDAANRQRAFGDRQMTFDPNGNLTGLVAPEGTTSFAWDARDRLTTVESPGTLANFSYAFGRRTSKVLNGATTRFLHDSIDVIQEFEDGHSNTYLRSTMVDDALAVTRSDETFSLVQDALGSTLAIHDASAHVMTEYTYGAFGAVAGTSPALPNAVQFTGRENDDVAGLYYYRARYYSPKLHRFLSEDPLGFSVSNNYAYAMNNPVGLVDPTGEFVQIIPPVIVLGAIIIVGTVVIISIMTDFGSAPKEDGDCKDPHCNLDEFMNNVVWWLCTYDCDDGKRITVKCPAQGCPGMYSAMKRVQKSTLYAKGCRGEHENVPPPGDPRWRR